MMKQPIKVAVIGGTGKSGKYVTNELINRAYPIRLLHRNPETLSYNNPLIEVIKGDARDPGAILELLTGAYSVISTLGQPVGEPSIFSDATRNILRAMMKLGISRYIVTTGLSVDAHNDRKGSITLEGTNWMKTNYPETTQDKQAEYELLLQSKIDWTLVRLPRIIETEKHGQTITSLTDCPGSSICAADLADFLIDQLTDHTFYRQAPFLANK